MILMLERNGTPHFTPRERQILHLVAHAYTNREIAQMLGMKESNVQNKIYTVMRITGVHNRIQIIRYAIEHGYAEGDYSP